MASSVQNIDPVMEKPWQRAQRLQQYDFYRKSAYPPMSIEPVPYERNRLAGEGMTAEQRALRKQWVKDQILHHEPRHVPELRPLNIFRRLYRLPADLLIEKPAMMLFSQQTASIMRYTIPKMLMAFGASYFIWYQLKYHQNDWTRANGVVVYKGKPILLGKEAKAAPEKDKTDYFDRGFKSRKVLLYKSD
ncbi:hypothetical protein RRG08_061723 [Elysia crispata]|uniref:Complex I-B17 n=1 Tax=Elysia crispata TaxID=231223 RepID=A0AAE1DTV1_9GAST|nr:hypothetical protein RRG08_061723 [Elysia crispata]